MMHIFAEWLSANVALCHGFTTVYRTLTIHVNNPLQLMQVEVNNCTVNIYICPKRSLQYEF